MWATLQSNAILGKVDHLSWSHVQRGLTNERFCWWPSSSWDHKPFTPEGGSGWSPQGPLQWGGGACGSLRWRRPLCCWMNELAAETRRLAWDKGWDAVSHQWWECLTCMESCTLLRIWRKLEIHPPQEKICPNNYIPTEFVRLSLVWVHSLTLCILGNIMQCFNWSD